MFKINETVAKILWLLAYIILLVSVAYLPHSYNAKVIYVVGLPVLVAVLETSLAYFQKHISLFFARKLLTMLMTLALIVLITLLLFYRWWTLPAAGFHFSPMMAVQFGLQGFVVGIAIRELLLNMSLNNLFDELIEAQRLLFLSGTVIFLYLLPPPSSLHGAYSPVYMFGFGGGLFAHFLLRRLSQRGAKVARHGKLLLDMLVAENEALSSTEKVAVKYFIKRNWKKLHQLYLEHLEFVTTLSAKLAIIESCMCRIRGQYLLALKTIEKVVQTQSVDTYTNGLLHLQEALVRSELGEDAEMYAALKESLKKNPKCFLTNVAYGVHLAEDIPMRKEEHNDSTDIQTPVHLIREAMRLNANERNTELLSNLIGHSVPLSWGFIQDAYGYALLKAGDYTFSRSLFLDCIRKEPNISSAYLHLGEWYLSYSLNRKPSKDRLTLANLCFSVALSLEGKKPSRIARRAKQMADEVKVLTNPIM